MERPQAGLTMEAFVNKFGYFPATVKAAERHQNGWTLITTDPDSQSDIVTFFDDTPPVRRENYEGRLA